MCPVVSLFHVSQVSVICYSVTSDCYCHTVSRVTVLQISIYQDADADRLNEYLYRQHTKDFLFKADDCEDDTKKEIDRNFVQDFSKFRHI